jgi:hypothetical protein
VQSPISDTNWRAAPSLIFFTVEVWTATGLKRFLVLFFIDLSTRKMEIAGIASSANGLWMSQIGRKVTDAVDGLLNSKRYLIHDRDPLFTAGFQGILASVGVTKAPAAVTESERLRRKICALNQRVVPGTPASVWRELIAHSGSGVGSALPYGTTPPRFEKPTH